MPRVVLVVVVALFVGCGGSEQQRAASTPTSTATAEAGALKRHAFKGFSMLVPTDWEQESDKDGVLWGAPDENGAIGFYVLDSPYQADEYIDQIILSDGNLKVRKRDKVKLEGVGTGTRLLLGKPGDPWWKLVAATIDGQLLDITIATGGHFGAKQVDQMLRSVERDA